MMHLFGCRKGEPKRYLALKGKVPFRVGMNWQTCQFRRNHNLMWMRENRA